MTSDKKSQNSKGFFLEIAKTLLLAIIIIVPVRIFLFQPFVVKGASMEPNFHARDYLIVNEFGYKDVSLFGDLISVEPRKIFARGDIAVFRAPVNNNKDFYIKRIIALPGETVRLTDSQITITNFENPEGFVLDESGYLPEGRITEGGVSLTLSDDEYFVLGDNRNASSDSRSFGAIKRDLVIGRVAIRAFPFTQIDVF